MFKFNNKHIFTGYLKQLLTSVNLPQYRIYTKEHELYFKKYGEESPDIIKTIKLNDPGYEDRVVLYAKYIKNGEIQEYVSYDNGAHYKWEPCKITETIVTDPGLSENAKPAIKKVVTHNHTYFPDKFELNNTRHLKIKNNVYDTYTHEYLGDYLRFQRDYYGLDLMPLYNCFSNNIATNIHFNFLNNTIIFDTDNTNYKIYLVPAKFFKKYTIAIDSSSPIELCCCIYQKYAKDSADDLNSKLAIATYKKYNSLKFDSPVIYDYLAFPNFDLLDPDSTAENNLSKIQKNELVQNEKNLKLLIKVPTTNTSSITILEGDFTKYNNRLYVNEDNKWLKLTNRVITNYELIPEDSEEQAPRTIEDISNNFKPITPLQLLQMNSGISYPFSDELIEYLSGNVITHLDTIPNNIKRVQKILSLNKYTTQEDGNWEPQIQPIIYDELTNTTNLKNFGPEILGYIDKNAETNVKHIYEDGSTIAISGADPLDIDESDWYIPKGGI